MMVYNEKIDLYQKALECFDNNELKTFILTVSQSDFDIDHRDERGRTLLHKSCFYKKIDFAIVLIALGADVNTGNINGTTPLMYAKTNILADEFFLLDYLIKSGSDINKKDNFGLTLFDYLDKNKDFVTKEYIHNKILK